MRAATLADTMLAVVAARGGAATLRGHGSLMRVGGQWAAPAGARACSHDERGPRLKIRREHVRLHFARSSGPGGQNVNKLNTKADLRLHVASATWIPEDIRERLAEREAARINRDGDLVVTSEMTRSQHNNITDALKKLQAMLDAAVEPPKERELYEDISKENKRRRVEHKRRRSDIKKRRRGRLDD